MHSRQVLSAGGESRRISWWEVGERLVRAGAGKPDWGGTMEWGSAVVVLYAHTNWFFKCRAVYARVEWICRVSLRVGDWRRRGVETGNANADKARVERECHELAAGRLQLHR